MPARTSTTLRAWRSQQRYQQDILQTNNRTRNVGGNVTGNWAAYVLNATIDKNDIFYDENSLTSTGGLPRISFSRGERPIGKSQDLLRREQPSTSRKSTKRCTKARPRRSRPDACRRQPRRPDPVHEVAVSDGELDVAWRDTYWTREPRHAEPVQVPEGVSRRLLRPPGARSPVRCSTGSSTRRTAATRRSSSTSSSRPSPSSGSRRSTSSTSIVQIDGTDRISGGVTRISYGLNNRLYAKQQTARAKSSASRSRRPTTRTPDRVSVTTRTIKAAYNTQCEAAELFSGADPVARVAQRPPPDRLLDRVRLDGSHVHDVHRERQLQRQPVPGHRRLEPAALHPGLPGIRQRGARQPRHQRLDDGPQSGQPPGRHLLVQLRPPQQQLPSAAHHWFSTMPSAAASMSSIRPTISAARRASWSRRTIGSTCRSRSPESAPSPTSSAPSAARLDGSERDGQGTRHRRRGFIGSNFVHHALSTHEDWQVTTLDKLTYAGRLENLQDVIDHPRHVFVQGDVADASVAAPLVQASEIVVHFAAETHVDRSILNAGEFITTDVFGTFVLLEAARQAPRAPSLRPDLDRRGLRQRTGGLQPGRRRASAAQPVFGQQGWRGSPRVQLLGDLRPAGHHHAGFEQLRAETIP